MKRRVFNFKQYRKELLLLAIVLLFIFFAGELFARIYSFGFINAFSSLKGVNGIGKTGYIQTSDNCEIIFELKPNIKGNFKFTRFETNSQGLRDKEYSIKKPPGIYRVAVIGDSFTLPEGVEIDESYHSILEKRFNDDGFKSEFINFAVPSYGLGEYFATMKYKALEYNPNAILIGLYFGNDLPHTLTNPKNVDNVTLELEEPEINETLSSMCGYKPLKEESAFFKSYLIQLIESNSIYNKIKNKLKKEEEEEEKEKQEIMDVEYDTKYIADMFNQFEYFSYEHNIPIIFVFLPEINTVSLHNRLHPRLIDFLCKKNLRKNFFVIDALPAVIREIWLTARAEGLIKLLESSYNKFRIRDGHPNDKANKVFADAIYEKWKEYTDNPNDRYQICIDQLKNYKIDKEKKHTGVQIDDGNGTFRIIPFPG